MTMCRRRTFFKVVDLSRESLVQTGLLARDVIALRRWRRRRTGKQDGKETDEVCVRDRGMTLWGWYDDRGGRGGQFGAKTEGNE